MTIQVEVWDLVGLLLAFFACIGAFGKALLVQIDKRFAAQEKARVEGSAALRATFEQHAESCQMTAREVKQLEREFMNWKADVPLQYVRREDYIRGQAVLEAKMDGLYSKLEVVQLKGLQHG